MKQVIKEGKILLNNKIYSTTAAFLGCYTDEEIKTYGGEKFREKLRFSKDETCYKYRTYLKAALDLKTDNILTFILFNPSTANPWKLDPTVNNCAKLAVKKGYSGFEIFNLFTARNPKITKDVIEDKNNQITPIRINPVFKNVVFAWGKRQGRLRLEKMQQNLDKIFEKYASKIEHTYTLEKDITRHPDPRAWKHLKGGFENNADLKEIKNFKRKPIILKNGRFEV